MIRLFYIGLIMLLCGLATGCRSPQPAVSNIREEHIATHDTIRQIDSILIHDGVLIRQSGDTVIVTRWCDRERIKYVDRWRDSVHTQIDTIPVFIDKPLTRWQQVKMDFGEVGIALLILMIAYIWLKNKL